MQLSLCQTNHLLCNSFKTNQNQVFTFKTSSFAKIPSAQLLYSLQNHSQALSFDSVLRIPTTLLSFSPKHYNSIQKDSSFLKTPVTHVAELLQNQLPTFKISSFAKIPSTCSLQEHFRELKIDSLLKIPATHYSNSLQNRLEIEKDSSLLDIESTHSPSLLQNDFSSSKIASFLLLVAETVSFPSFAAEINVPTEQASDKINLEEVLIVIDDFFNRNPFFVATLTFIWLVVIPVVQGFLKKYKYISTFDAYGKLKNEPNAQLLDIRNEKTLSSLRSPNLKILNKNTIQVEYKEGEDDRFVKEVLMNFSDPENTILCVLDNFDGNSLKVAELLFKNGFKEAYAIKGGIRGKDGWQEIQETLLPPSVHVFPKKKSKKKNFRNFDINSKKLDDKSNTNMATSTTILSDGVNASENGYMKPTGAAPQLDSGIEKPLSPYPNYPDLKPPSSPTPSKPN